MASFFIRRNHPHAGLVTLTKIPGGAFTAREMVVAEHEFVAELFNYLDKLTPAEASRLRRSVPRDQPPPKTGKFKVKTPTAAVS